MDDLLKAVVLSTMRRKFGLSLEVYAGHRGPLSATIRHVRLNPSWWNPGRKTLRERLAA